MALPTIVFDSSDGAASDTAASGAGPATAVTGTNAAHTGGAATTTITLTNSPDLSGVAVDGSAVLYLAISTAGIKNFSKITAVDNGAKTVTVADSFTIAGGSPVSYAIGGKRKFLETASSRKLADNNSAAGDLMPGWTLQFASGHAETLASAVRFRRGGDTTDGPIVIQGDPSAATKPVLTWSNNGNAIQANGGAGAGIHFRNFSMRNSNGTKTASVAIVGVNTADSFSVENVDVGGTAAGTSFWKATNNATGAARFFNCEFAYCANVAIDGTATGGIGVWIESCRIHHSGSHAINAPGSGQTYHIKNNLIYANTGTGIVLALSSTTDGYGTVIENNTIDGNAAGISITGTNQILECTRVVNNLVTNNTGAGIAFSATANAILNYGAFVRNNNLYGNGSSYSPAASGLYGEDDPGLNPYYADRANGDFRVRNPLLVGEGWPDQNLGSAGSTAAAAIYRSYSQIGALLRRDASSFLRRLSRANRLR